MRLIVWTLLFGAAGAVQGQSWTTGTFIYDGAGNITAMGTDTFLYDSAGRLVKGTADQQRSGGSNRQEYSYDAFGNRVVLTTVGTACVGACPPTDLLISAASNRITNHGAVYDAAGNVTALDGYTFTYDAAGMMARQTGPQSTGPIDWQYVYTADDERIATYTGGGNWRFTVRDLDGKVLREVVATTSGGTTTWTWDRDHVFRDGLLLATVSPSGQQQFHLDHLGNPRLVTNAAGLRTGIHSYYPFGDELSLTPAETPAERLKYTAHERDETSSMRPLDYMHARYYSPLVGRFLSVDPMLNSAILRRPQSWNRYSYGWNTPVLLTDPTGERVFLSGNVEDALQAVADALEDPTAAGMLIAVTRGGQTELRIVGDDYSSFSNGGENAAAQTIADAIQSTSSIRLFLGTNALNSGQNYPAHTDEVDKNGRPTNGTRNSVISIDPAGFPYYTHGLNMFENLSSALIHEFGHALGIASGNRSIYKIGPYAGTNWDAIVCENKARDWYLFKVQQRYGVDSIAGKAAERVWRHRDFHD
jgi:RHS repeat-associated protein